MYNPRRIQVIYADMTWWKQFYTSLKFNYMFLASLVTDKWCSFATDVENASWSCINEVRKEIAKAQIEKAVGLQNPT